MSTPPAAMDPPIDAPADAHSEAELVSLTNRVLSAAGLESTVSTSADVRAVCASTTLFLAAAEAILGARLPVATRAPQTDAERVPVLRAVLRHLSEHVLRADLSHVSAERIVAGAHRDIRDLVEILAALSRHRPVPQPGAHTAGRADAWAAGSDAGEAAPYAASDDAEEIERIAKEAEAEVRRKTRRAKRAAAPKGGKQMVQLTAKAKAGVRAATPRKATPTKPKARGAKAAAERIRLPTDTVSATGEPDDEAAAKPKGKKKRAAALPVLDVDSLAPPAARSSLRPLRALQPKAAEKAARRERAAARLLKPPYASEVRRPKGASRRPQSARKAGGTKPKPTAPRPQSAAPQPSRTPRTAARDAAVEAAGAGFAGLSAPLADKLGRVLRMAAPGAPGAPGAGGAAAAQRPRSAPARREASAEERTSQVMDMWARGRKAQRRADEAIAAKREKAAAMLARHEARRAQIAAAQFARGVAAQRESARLRREAEEEVLFRELFESAVDREKARLLEERRAARLVEDEAFRRGTSVDASKEEALRAQCGALTAASKAERRARLSAERAVHAEERRAAREQRESVREERRQLMDDLEVAESAAWFRGHDPDVVAAPVVAMMADRIREEALRLQRATQV